MADNREIVGWFYRNGKRIPIKAKKSSEKSAMNKAHDELNHTLGPNELYARVHSVGLDGTVSYSKDVQTGGNPYYDNPDLDTREVETEYGTTKMPLRAGKGKAQLRRNVRKRRDNPISERAVSYGRDNHTVYDVDYDTSGGHVHNTHLTKDEARDFLRRNGKGKVKRGK